MESKGLTPGGVGEFPRGVGFGFLGLSMATFREAAAAEYGWDPEDFEAKVFLHCLETFPRLLARILWIWRDRLFKADLAAIGLVADLTSYNDVFQVAQSFADSHRDRGFLRDTLGLRPRGRRLLSLARELLPGRRQTQTTLEPANRAGTVWRKSDARDPAEAVGDEVVGEAGAEEVSKAKAGADAVKASEKPFIPAKGAALRAKKRSD